MSDPFSDLIPQGGSQQGGGIPVTRYSIPKSALGGTQGDEMSDPNTARGVGISENELGPAVVAVNPSVYPYGTIFRNAQTNEVFIAGDKHGNENPNVVDLYSPPSAYRKESGTMPLVPIDRIRTNQIPKSYSGVSELLANYGKVPEGEGAYASLGKTQQKEDPFADLIPQAQGTNAPAQPQAQEQTADPFADLLPQQQAQANPDAAFLTAPSPTQEQTGKVINLPAINPIENALRNFANTAATSTLNTVGGAVRYFNSAQQKDLKMAQEELAQAQESGESPEQINEIQGRIDSFNEQIPQVQEAVKSITDLSNQYPEAYGVSPEDKSTSAQIGRGLGQVASFIPTMALGPAGAPLGALQGASQAYEGTYQQTLQSLESQGVTDKALMEDKAQREASIAAVKSLPQLATYMVGGKLASAGVSKLLSTQTPLIQGAAGAVAGSIMNTAAGATIRKIMGESVMPTVESLTQDIAFGLFHGVGTGVEAQQKLRFEEQKRKLEEQKLGGPAPQVAPSSNPEVNKREAEILASADAQYAPPLETAVEVTTQKAAIPSAKVRATTPDLTSLIEEQLFLDEGSPEYAAIQKQIDDLNKPTGETTAPAAKPTEVTPAKEPTPTLPATGGELTANLVESGTSLESFGKDSLVQLAEYYGVDVPKDASRGEIIDAINSKRTAEAPATEGQAPKEEVAPTKPAKPQEVTLTEEQQAEKVLLDKIDAEAGKPKAPKAKAPEANPYEEVLRRYESGEENSINTPEELVNEIYNLAKKKQNQYLKDAVDRYYKAMDVGADVAPEVQKLLDEVKREGNRYKAPASEKAPKRKTAKDKALDVLGDAANGLSYVLENKILDPITYKRMVKSGIIPKGGGEYDFFKNSKLPRKVRDLIFSRDGSPIDVIASEMGKTPDELLGEIQEAYIAKEKLDQETKVEDQKNKALQEEFKRMEALKKTNPEAYAQKEEQEVRKFLIKASSREGGFIEFPDFIKDAAIRVGDSVRKGIASFKEWSSEMVSRLGEGVRNFLKDIWAGVRNNWNKDIGGGFDTGGRSLEMAAEEAKFAPKAPTEQEAFAKKAADAILKGRGTPITEQEMGKFLARMFPGISPSEVSDLYATASGKPKPPAPYAGVAADQGKLLPQRTPIGISKESVENQRLARMLDNLPESERESNAVKINDAFEKNKNQNIVEGLIQEIVDGGKTIATPEEVALLNVEMNRLQLERERIQNNFEQTDKRPSDYSVLNQEIRPIEDKIDRLERAVDKIGTSAGRLLQMFKIMLAEDYSPVALEKKAVRDLRRDLTPQEKETISRQAKEIKDLQDKLNQKQGQVEEKDLNASVKDAYERQIAELKEQAKPDPAVQNILNNIANALKSPADAARERIAKRRKERGGRLFTGVDPERLADIADAAIIGAEKIAKGASNLAKWTAEMKSEFGDGILPYIKDVWNKSLENFKNATSRATTKVSESIKKKVSKIVKGEVTREDIINRAKAEAEAGEELSYKTVYDLARDHILDGIRGEDNVMKAVHNDIMDVYPDATERDVRRAFSEYGKAKFPSAEEDKVQLRQLRTLVRLQESIDRLKEGLPALRTGLQRDRANQAIREKTTILNNLLKQVKIEPTQEELTSRLEAKKNALRNRIEDLDAQLQGKAKPIEKGQPVPLDVEGERLTSLRDAMQQKLREVEAAERKAAEKSPEEKYNDRRQAKIKQDIADIENRMRRGDYSKKEKKPSYKKSPETELLEKKLANKRREADLWREEKEKEDRPRWEKALRTTSETAREITVAGINVLYKIGKYAIIKPITTPIGEIAGYTARQLGGLGKVRGEYESGASPLKTIPAYYRGYWKAMKQFVRVLKSGYSDSELLYDKRKQNNTNWFRWIGSNLHAAIKNLPSTAKEELYREHLYANAIADGLIDPKNPSDPKNQMAIAGLNLKAYLASKAEKLQEDNKIAEAINNLHRWAESPDKEGRINPYTSAASHGIKIAITKGIYKIGLNFLKQTGQAATGLPRGVASLLNAYWKGLDTLTPKEMDYITKAFKVGSVPAALMTWAILDAFKDDKDKVFGGYYEQGRKKGDVKWGEVRINGKQFSLHVPEIEAAQFANTMARHFIKNASKTDLGMNALESFLNAMGGVFAEAPITGPVTQIVKSPKSAASYIFQGFVPSAVRDIAKMQDVNAEGEVISRYPRTSLESIQKGIPGLREKLPSKPLKSQSSSKSSKPFYQKSSQTKKSKPFYAK